jgi:hypothetical protein
VPLNKTPLPLLFLYYGQCLYYTAAVLHTSHAPRPGVCSTSGGTLSSTVLHRSGTVFSTQCFPVGLHCYHVSMCQCCSLQLIQRAQLNSYVHLLCRVTGIPMGKFNSLLFMLKTPLPVELNNFFRLNKCVILKCILSLRSRVRFLIVSLEFFIDIILPAAL